MLVIHIDTPGVDENEVGPLLRMYLNDDSVYENPPYPGPQNGEVPCLNAGDTTCYRIGESLFFEERPQVPVPHSPKCWDTATRYGEMAWSFGDVTSLEAWNDKDWTPDQAEEFLQQNGKHIRDRLIAVGFEVMEDLLATWTPEKADDQGNDGDENTGSGEAETEEPSAEG